MEGYLQKRFKIGVVKTLKKRWYVLKDGELRCYQTKEAYEQKAELHQECIPIGCVQTVRTPSDEHFGIQIVTQQKVTILVASSKEEQHKWIDAIYEMKKEERPRVRSISCTDGTVTTENSNSKQRLSTGSKYNISRILPATITRKFSNEKQNYSPSTFYVDQTAQEKAESKEMGTQVDLSHQNSSTTGEGTGAGTVGQDGIGERARRDSHPCDDGEGPGDGGTPAHLGPDSQCEYVAALKDEVGPTCATTEETSDVPDGELEREVSDLCPHHENPEDGVTGAPDDDHGASLQETELGTANDAVIEDAGIKQLRLMLGTSSLMPVSAGEGVGEDEGDRDSENDSPSLNYDSLESADSDDDYDADNGNSAFDQLQQMLLKT